MESSLTFLHKHTILEKLLKISYLRGRNCDDTILIRLTLTPEASNISFGILEYVFAQINSDLIVSYSVFVPRSRLSQPVLDRREDHTEHVE